MDEMLGIWTVVPGGTENFDSFAAALKFPPELAAKIKKDQDFVKVEMTREGDVYTILSDVNGQVETLSFKLGQQFVSKGFGMETQNEFQEEGDVVVGKHTVCGQETTSSRYLKDGQLCVENTGNGVTMKSVMKRC